MASIHAPARGATGRGYCCTDVINASIHAPARGATPALHHRAAENWLQSTLPHGERPGVPASVIRSDASIHAPARGATYWRKNAPRREGASIHAPARGATAAQTAVEQGFVASIHAPARGATFGSLIHDWILEASIHAPARGATFGSLIHDWILEASIHAPARGATNEIMRAIDALRASIHAPARGATSLLMAVPSGSLLQSTLPHGERPTGGLPWLSSRALQSTLPHGERHMRRVFFCKALYASIHAPARGATTQRDSQGGAGGASIHAPARGATPQRTLTTSRQLLQSTLPYGERPGYWCRCRGFPQSFNPRSRTGSDLYSLAPDTAPQLQLQSTLPHGERRQTKSCASATASFNPRSRTGSDVPVASKICAVAVLQSTLPHGERLKSAGNHNLAAAASIHAPARGATRAMLSLSSPPKASIHAPARGATKDAFGKYPDLALQSTLPHGERQTVMFLCKAKVGFNPRSRTGSDGRGLCSVHILRAGFNPRSRTGSDTGGGSHKCDCIGLQSTLPHGERLALAQKTLPAVWLQSTLPHGERHVPPDVSDCTSLLQSTLPHGERRPWIMFCPHSQGRLQSTLPHGERPWVNLPALALHRFNPRSRTGSDGTCTPKPQRPGRFNPRSRTGSDDEVDKYEATNAASIHAPARGATPEYLATPRASVLQSTLPHGERPCCRRSLPASR